MGPPIQLATDADRPAILAEGPAFVGHLAMRWRLDASRAREVDIEAAECTRTGCRIALRFDRLGGCAYGLALSVVGEPQPASPSLRRTGEGTYECTLAWDGSAVASALDAAPKSGPDASDAARRIQQVTEAVYPKIESDCLEPIVRMRERIPECPPMDPISDPIAPEPPPPLRALFDLGAMWRPGRRGDDVGLTCAVALDWSVGGHVAVGAGLRYAASGGGAPEDAADRVHELMPAARLRITPTAWDEMAQRRFELHVEAGHSIVVGGSSDGDEGGASSAPFVGMGLFGAFRAISIGIGYTRDFGRGGDDAGADRVWLLAERTTGYPSDRHDHEAAPKVGLGLEIVGTGWAFADGLGPMLPGVGIDLPVWLGSSVMPLVRWDWLWFPGVDAEATTMQSLLGGLDWEPDSPYRIGIDAAAGYVLPSGDELPIGSGAIADIGVRVRLDDQGIYAGAHGRTGLEADDDALRALFLVVGARQIF